MEELKAATPSLAKRVFTVVGLLAATTGLAVLVTAVASFERERPFAWTLFAFVWGICANLLLLSVERGIRTNRRSLRDPGILGEQQCALRVTTILVRLELAVAAVALALDRLL